MEVCHLNESREREIINNSWTFKQVCQILTWNLIYLYRWICKYVCHFILWVRARLQLYELWLTALLDCAAYINAVCKLRGGVSHWYWQLLLYANCSWLHIADDSCNIDELQRWISSFYAKSINMCFSSYLTVLLSKYLSVPLLYHSMGQIISCCVSVYVQYVLCMYVSVCGHTYDRIFQPIFTKFGNNLWGPKRKNWLGWGRNPKMPSLFLPPKNKNLLPR